MSVNGRAKPRLGFLGVGWIGRKRLEAIAASEVAEIVAIADASLEAAREAASVAPGCLLGSSLEALLEAGLDGVVIATPSAAHAEQSIAALEAGVPVFCQKPLGRTAQETARVVEVARAADRLLGVDLSYRHTDGMRRVRELVRSGELGEVFAADLVFHNAYGPDKPWFYDPRLSGGGCVMDLGIHLVDLVLWTLGWPEVESVAAKLRAAGKPVRNREVVEDFAEATLALSTGTTVRLACSWRLHAGRDCAIEATFHGTRGGASFRNVDGSFYDFTAERFRGTARESLSQPPDAWGGRAAVEWARRLALSRCYDAEAERLVTVARVLDGIYGA
jgi:predicted dehydrogenase